MIPARMPLQEPDVPPWRRDSPGHVIQPGWLRLADFDLASQALWLLPIAGGALFSVLATLWLTSSLWYFTNVRFGF